MLQKSFLALFLATSLLSGPIRADDPCEPKPTSNAADASAVSKPLRVERDIEFTRPNDEPVFADVYRIDSSDPLPVVIVIHGGGWFAGDKSNLRDHAREMAQAGFVVMSINYRLAPKSKFPAQLEDCGAAVDWMKQNADQWHADMNRVGVWGYSAGGHLAALLATEDRTDDLPLIRCCVAGGAPCDLTLVPEKSGLLKGFLGATRQENPDVYSQASPVTFVSEQDCPFFLFHGNSDMIVPIEMSKALETKLESTGIENEYMEIEGGGHFLTFINMQARAAAIEFLKKHLTTDQDQVTLEAKRTTPPQEDPSP